MDYKVVTYLNPESWTKNGLSWLRMAKSLGLKGHVVGNDLSEEAVDKIRQMGFEHIPLIGPQRKVEVFDAFVNHIKPSERVLWCHSDIPPRPVDGGADVICGSNQSSVYDLTECVLNLYDRAAMVDSLEERIFKKYNTLLSTRWIEGSSDFWYGYVGCQRYMESRNYFEPHAVAEDLVLNFFLAFANKLTIKLVAEQSESSSVALL
jgi:hypothetical protein